MKMVSQVITWIVVVFLLGVLFSPPNDPTLSNEQTVEKIKQQYNTCSPEEVEQAQMDFEKQAWESTGKSIGKPTLTQFKEYLNVWGSIKNMWVKTEILLDDLMSGRCW
jgi:hypothetical protein